jgi:hypothetical protein
VETGLESRAEAEAEGVGGAEGLTDLDSGVAGALGDAGSCGGC